MMEKAMLVWMEVDNAAKEIIGVHLSRERSEQVADTDAGVLQHANRIVISPNPPPMEEVWCHSPLYSQMTPIQLL